VVALTSACGERAIPTRTFDPLLTFSPPWGIAAKETNAAGLKGAILAAPLRLRKKLPDEYE
jgi:hypothetical protein